MSLYAPDVAEANEIRGGIGCADEFHFVPDPQPWPPFEELSMQQTADEIAAEIAHRDAVAALCGKIGPSLFTVPAALDALFELAELAGLARWAARKAVVEAYALEVSTSRENRALDRILEDMAVA